MRAMRRAKVMLGLMTMALLPVAAAVSAEPAAQPPMAIVQPLGVLNTAAVASGGAVLPESGLLVLVGTGLLGLAAVVRRTTRDS